MFSPGIERALRISLEAHAGQHRKGAPDVPYITHPLHVAMMLARLDLEEVVLQAALLHDVVEDCDGWTVDHIRAEFGAEVARLVASLTDPEGEKWEVRKRLGIEKAASMDARAAAVKAADKLHNLHSLAELVRQAPSVEVAWKPFSRGKETTLAMSRELVETLAPRVPKRLGMALLAAMDELESLSR